MMQWPTCTSGTSQIEVLVQLKYNAKKEGRSLNRHVVALLEDAVANRNRRTLEEVLASIDERVKNHPLSPDARMPEDRIREDRDSREL